MRGIRLPDEAAVPRGPLRDLTLIVHEVYQAAGQPSARQIAQQIADNPALTGTASHESVRAVLNGRLTRWDVLQAVGYQLAQMAHPPRDPNLVTADLLRHWNQAQHAVDDVISGIQAGPRPNGLREDVEEILREVDMVLEDNPEEFVRRFVQTSGQSLYQTKCKSVLARFPKLVLLLTSQVPKPSAADLVELIQALMLILASEAREIIDFTLLEQRHIHDDAYLAATLAIEGARGARFPLDRFLGDLQDSWSITDVINLYFPYEDKLNQFFYTVAENNPGHFEYFTEIFPLFLKEAHNQASYLIHRRPAPTRSREGADFEHAIRRSLLRRDYPAAEKSFELLQSIDSDRAEELREEIGFLWLDDSDRDIAVGFWSRLAVGHPARPKVRDIPLPPAVAVSLEVAFSPAAAPSVTPSTRRRQAYGTPPSRLIATREYTPTDIIQRLFKLPPEAGRELAGMVQSTAKRSDGGWPSVPEPWEFTATPRSAPDTICRVLCYRRAKPITMAIFAPAVMQRETLLENGEVDYFVVLSFGSEIDQEVDTIAAGWNERQKYPATVRLFGAAALRDAATHPEVITASLRHRPRVPGQWRHYLDNPALLAFPDEDHVAHSATYSRQLPTRFADDRGTPLPGSAFDHVMAWLQGDQQGLVVVGDFGDGKTFFTYNLARRLFEVSKSAGPGAECIPLRLALRDLPVARNPRDLLSRRLDDLGLRIADWQRLVNGHATLVILDGFDEMSNDLSRESLLRNIKLLRACYQMFASSKILLTSRGRAFGSPADQRDIFDRIGNPETVQLRPFERAEVLASLLTTAEDSAQQAKVRRLQGLHDPIGLATKPLYHAMIRETLPQLPPDDFTEETLYETYVRKTLDRKFEYLEDDGLRVRPAELVDNLISILERVATELHQANAPYLYLKTLDLRGLVPDNHAAGLAQALWKMREGAEHALGTISDEDATARVGIRSLLKGHPDGDADQWPVDFSHRSMREYFVARAIAGSIAQDSAEPPLLLSRSRLPPEILRFTALILRSGASERTRARLLSWARSVTMTEDPSPLGANALSLLYAYTSEVPGRDWAGLRLDYAQLAGADLEGRSLRGTSLRHANLDNVNLTDADLRDADLSGVRLEETSAVTAIAAGPGDVVYAAYGDLSLREWKLQAAQATNHVLQVMPHRVDRLWVTPNGRLGAVGESTLTLLSKTADAWTSKATFRVQSRYRPPHLSGRRALLADEGTGTEQLLWLDPAADTASITDLPEVRAWAVQDKDGFVAVTSDLVVVRLGETQVQWHEELVAAVALQVAPSGEVLVGLGRQDGAVRLIKLLATDTGMRQEEIWTRQRHTGPVTALTFLEPGRLVSGGADRALCVMPTTAIGEGDTVSRYELTLRCSNVRVDGLRGDREQKLLRHLSTR